MKGRQQRNNTKAIGSDKEAYQESQIRLSTRAWLLIQGWISKNLLWDFSQGASVCSHDLPYRVKHNEEKISIALVDPHYFHVHCFLISFQVNWGRTNPAPQTYGTEWHDPYKHHVHQPMRAKVRENHCLDRKSGLYFHVWFSWSNWFHVNEST